MHLLMQRARIDSRIFIRHSIRKIISLIPYPISMTCTSMLAGKAYLIFRVRIILVRTLSRAAGSYEEDAEESEQTPTHEFNGSFDGRMLEVSVEDGGTDNNGEGEEDELHRNNLC